MDVSGAAGHGEAWQVTRQPMMQQALAENLVELQMEDTLDAAEWQGLGALTALTSLTVPAPVNLAPGGRNPVHALNFLTRLKHLHLTDPCRPQISLADANLAPLTQLSRVDLTGLQDSFALAGTAASVSTLYIVDDVGSMGQAAPATWRTLLHLTSVYLEELPLGPAGMDCLRQLPRLQALTVHYVAVDDQDRERISCGLGRLTALTTLELDRFGCHPI